MFHLSESGSWVSQIYGQGEEVSFCKYGFRCDIASIYRKFREFEG
jgi:hypothetical protein